MSLFPIFSPAAAPVVEITHLGTAATAANQSSYTFTSQPLGSAADEIIVICVSAPDGAGTNNGRISSATIDGNSASVVKEQITHPTWPGATTSIWQYAGSTSSTGTIVINHVSTCSENATMIYKVSGANSSAHDTGGDDGPQAAMTDTLTIPANGGAIGCGVVVATAQTVSWSWTNLDEDEDAQWVLSGSPVTGYSYTCASKTFDTLQTNLSITGTSSHVVIPGQQAVALASWGPA